ncbi:MAG: hypothetical protein CMJ76_03425 [Planctomycetaceae bacterium]|nr:hypothetical protein [Planctomycetaceae bacterium]|tara:strand:- start:1380 stop:1949 length:570 start_codon:yes stop_codon:yes gene_type:complete
MTDWYYQTEKGAEAGPISNSELKNLVSSGAVTSETLLRKDDAKWVKAAAVGGLFEAVQEFEVRNVCPYCNSTVFKIPGKCPSCNREITVSLRTRAGLQKGPAEPIPESRSVAAIQSVIREESLAERRYIILFAVLCTLHLPLAGWLFNAIEDGYTVVSWLVGACLVVLNIAAVITFLKARKFTKEETES